MSVKSTVYLGLGSNSHDKVQMLQRARIVINLFMGQITRKSNLYLTEPWGEKNQDTFLNQVVKIKTSQQFKSLCASLLKTEIHLGKLKSNTKYGPRNIDIDLLFFDDFMQKNGLIVPHPRLHQRKFVLQPMNEIAPDYIHPVFNLTISSLLKNCPDNSDCTILNPDQ